MPEKAKILVHLKHAFKGVQCIEISCIAEKHWALHADIAGLPDAWSVSHTVSGLRLGRSRTKAAAIKLFKAAIAEFPNYEHTGLPRDTPSRLRELDSENFEYPALPNNILIYDVLFRKEDEVELIAITDPDVIPLLYDAGHWFGEREMPPIAKVERSKETDLKKVNYFATPTAILSVDDLPYKIWNPKEENKVEFKPQLRPEKRRAPESE